MAGTKTQSCTCASKFQDQTYGNKQRLHNVSEDGKKAKCTVCGNVKNN